MFIHLIDYTCYFEEVVKERSPSGSIIAFSYLMHCGGCTWKVFLSGPWSTFFYFLEYFIVFLAMHFEGRTWKLTSYHVDMVKAYF